jgi:Fe-S cluster assembly protein SufD
MTQPQTSPGHPRITDDVLRGLPREPWKYTNLPRMLQTLQCTPLCTTIGCLEAALPVVAGPQAVFHNGVLAENLSQSLTLAPGVTLTTTPAQQPAEQHDPLDALPAPFHYTLIVQGKVLLPLHLIHVISGQPSVARFTVNLLPGASLTLVEHHVAAPRFASWQHTGVEITVAQGAQLTHSILQTLPPACMLTRRTQVTVQPTATYTASQLQHGGVFSRIETHATLTTNCTFAHTALSLTRHSQHHDVTLTITHVGENNQTHIRARNLVDDDGHAVFQGKFYVAKEAQKTNAYMHCHNMLLSNGARTSHKPELEIYADDVKCSHGAATGGLNASQLFYLRARGLSPQAARALLLEGFAEEFISQFPEALHTALRQRLHRWLAEIPHSPPEDDEFVPLEGEWLAERAETPHLRVVTDSEEIHDE